MGKIHAKARRLIWPFNDKKCQWKHKILLSARSLHDNKCYEECLALDASNLLGTREKQYKCVVIKGKRIFAFVVITTAKYVDQISS